MKWLPKIEVTRRLLATVLTLTVVNMSSRAWANPDRPPARVRLQCSLDGRSWRVVLPVEDNRVSLGDLAAAAVELRGYDHRWLNLPAAVSRRSISCRRLQQWVRCSAGVLELTYQHRGGAAAAVAHGPAQVDRAILQIDRQQIQQARRATKGFVRDQIARWWPTSEGLSPVERLQIYAPSAPVKTAIPSNRSSRPVVLLLHGLNSTSRQLQPLRRVIAAEGYRTATFDYPNDQAIAESAQQLREALRHLSDVYPRSAIAIVTHSMGGLVARCVIEDPAFAVDQVRALTMICPPNHGSNLAEMACLNDVWEHWIERPRSGRGVSLTGPVRDGLGEAATDLKPGSLFLLQLNSRPRNRNVQYTIVLGDRGIWSPAQHADAESSLTRLASPIRITRLVGSKAQRILTELDEPITGLGDGVVSVSKGRLAGVDDVHIFPMRHGDLLQGSGDVTRDVHRLILNRLQLLQ